MRKDDTPVLREWKSRRDMHPFISEDVDDETLGAYWERVSEHYSDAPQGRMADDIVACLEELGVIREGRSLLDVGCGPGTYALRMSPLVDEVVALDRSRGMLERLRSECRDRDITNVVPTEGDWTRYDPQRRFDVVFSALCPQTNDPESLLRMEGMSSRYCAYVSSMTEDGDSLHFRIWRRMGKEYSYSGYDTRLPMRYLQDLGRDPLLTVFSEDPGGAVTVEDAFCAEKDRFSLFGRDDEESLRLIREVVDDAAEDGMIVPRTERRLGLLVWEKPRS